MRLRLWSALVRRGSEVIADCVPGQVPRHRTGWLRRQLGEVSAGGRVAIVALVLSATGLVHVATREGWCAQACRDPVHGTAVPTIGFGSTQGVKMGDKTNPVSALNRTLREVQSKEEVIKRCAAGVELHQHEYDAYVELAHNIGEGAFCRSSIVKALRSQQYEQACDHILDWKYVKDVDCSKPNKVCTGLWTDRLRLHRQCKGEAT